MQNQANAWKTLYTKFEIRLGSASTVKPNEILLDVASMMRTHLNVNNCFFIVICLDALSSTINYECLLGMYIVLIVSYRIYKYINN